MKSLYVGLALTLLVSVNAHGHHSFAPHFDSDKPITMVGTIIKYEQRNPHAYLTIDAEDANGRLQRYRCESHGWTQLSRNGITPDMLAVGSQIGISGSRHRRDENMCFFDTVYLADGQEISVNGSRDREKHEVAQRSSIFGTWLLTPAGRPTSGRQSMMDFLTAKGRAAVDTYNPFTDDPTYRCEPVAIRRAWFAPGTPMAIQELNNNIIIQHEWMDVQRTIHMNGSAVPENAKHSILGYSRGHYDEDTLVIETTHYSEGVLNQFVTVEGEPMRGLLHSDQLKTIERITFMPDINRFELTIEHYDPTFFTQDFQLVSAQYSASDLSIDPFGCIPELLK